MPLIRPYARDPISQSGPGDARPTATQIIHDQELLSALPDTKILITGGTSGIGLETARALYLTGAEVFITARDAAKGKAVADELSTDPTRPVKVIEMHLDSFASIRAGAAVFLEQSDDKLNILICNAGIMACPFGLTADGHELQFGTNHLGHFLLFHLLKPALLAGAKASGKPSRIISVSSTGHRLITGLDVSALTTTPDSTTYSPWQSYATSKLAQIHFANSISRRYRGQGLTAFSLHPGSIATPLQRHVQDDPRYAAAMQDPAYRAQRKSPEQGAATSVWAAIGGELEGKGGLYLEDCGEAGPAEEGTPGYGPGFSTAAFDETAEERLWEVSRRMCGISE